MTAVTKNPSLPKRFSDPLKALEQKIKLYVLKIYNLQERQAALEKTIADLQTENFQLKKELSRLAGEKGA